jgi:hypothetical protein
MDKDWPDDLPAIPHDPGECDECDWNRERVSALIDGRSDPGPFVP